MILFLMKKIIIPIDGIAIFSSKECVDRDNSFIGILLSVMNLIDKLVFVWNYSFLMLLNYIQSQLQTSGPDKQSLSPSRNLALSFF